MLMLAQSVAHAQVFVLLRLSAFPKHLGHTREQIPSRVIRLGIFVLTFAKCKKKADLCVNKKKNPYICNQKDFFI
jgi:hypothetical protein